MWHTILHEGKYVSVYVPTKQEEYSYLGKIPGTPEWEKVSQLRDILNEQEKDSARS